MNKIPVGILGATGTVGQRFCQLLADHPWFEVTALAASGRSAGQRYAEACHWLLPTPIPDGVGDLIVQPIEPGLDCRLVFSALPSRRGWTGRRGISPEAGYAVCTNAAPHRMATDVPLLIPEVNCRSHGPASRRRRREQGWKGLIAASANCSATQLALAPQAPARHLWPAPGIGGHDASNVRRRLSRRAIAGHCGQRGPLYRQRGGQGRDRAAQAAGHRERAEGSSRQPL